MGGALTGWMLAGPRVSSGRLGQSHWRGERAPDPNHVTGSSRRRWFRCPTLRRLPGRRRAVLSRCRQGSAKKDTRWAKKLAEAHDADLQPKLPTIATESSADHARYGMVGLHTNLASHVRLSLSRRCVDLPEALLVAIGPWSNRRRATGARCAIRLSSRVPRPQDSRIGEATGTVYW
jgi:hypothetical protein